MKSSIFIPEKLKVGFVDRPGTYTGKLAFVIYYDHKGLLRKEDSWEGWRDKNIAHLDLANEPTSGFVLNKKAGGYGSGWHHRQSKIRVYDPRGFEFEISIENLLFILENTNSMKGKGLEGDFVYGWAGKDIVLIPSSSPDYLELTKFNDTLHQKKNVKSKELVLGATYQTKTNNEYIYLGKFEHYSYGGIPEGQKFFFGYPSDLDVVFITMKTLGDKLISVVSADCVSNYADLLDKLQKQRMFSPYDKSKDQYVPYDLADFILDLNDRGFNRVFCFTHDHIPIRIDEMYRNKGTYQALLLHSHHSTGGSLCEGSLESIFSIIKPMYLNKYLKNGELNEHKARQ
jgi:hypothetical protein